MKAIQLLAASALVIAAFFIGRGSVKEVAPAPPPALAQERKLTAIRTADDPAPSDVSVSTNPRESNTPRHFSPSTEAREGTKAIAAILEEEEPDLWDISDLISQWLERDPDEAIAWLATGEERSQVLMAIFAIWASESPEAASAWLEANPNLDGHDGAVYGLALGFAEGDRPEDALELAKSIADPASRAKIWASAGSQLFAINQDELRQRLAESDIPPGLQEGMLEDWRTNLRNRSRRNAQNLASVYSSAFAAGANFESTTPEEIVRELVSGINGSDSFADTRFQVPNMSESDIRGALENLDLAGNGVLNYNPAEDSER